MNTTLGGAVPDSGVDLIANERTRQVAVERWTPEHDDTHRDGELARAAAAYAIHAGSGAPGNWRTASGNRTAPVGWPWWAGDWKPSTNSVRDLTKAGALIAAEIDRIQRSGRETQC